MICAPRRTRLPAHLLLVAALTAAISACGDNAGAVDAGAPVDARDLTDAALVACAIDAEPDCSAELLTPICDIERNACAECVTDGDCERGGAFGPACEQPSGYCQCARDEDCAGNDNGPTCHGVVHACTCLLDQDCADGQECALEPYLGSDVRTCRRIAAR